MKVVLITPPVVSPYAPLLGVNSLKCFLKRNGIKTFIIDASIDALHYLLSPENFQENLSISIKRYEDNVPQNVKSLIYNQDIKDNFEHKGKILEDEIMNIIKNTWTDEGFQIKKKQFEYQITGLNDALVLSCLHFYPTILTLNQCFANLEFLKNPRINPFISYYRNKLIPQLRSFQPDLIGTSFCYRSQLLPGLSMIAEIRKCLKAPVIVGGSFFTLLCQETVLNNNSHDESTEVYHYHSPSSKIISKLLSPYGIQGEGEGPFLEFCQKFKKGKPLQDILSLVYSDAATKTIFFNKKAPSLAVNKLPPLDLDGLSIGKKYLSPIPIAPLMSSRGCYWNKCAFCSRSTVIDSQYREFPVETVINILKSYKKHNIEGAFFCDECMSVSMLKKLSEKISESGIQIHFGIQARIEKNILKIIEPAAKAGLKFIAFGLESGCPRLVTLMNKGYTHDIAQAVLDECFRNNIFVQYFVMFGFPTEKLEEAQQTIAFLEKDQDKIASISPSVWWLKLNSHIGKNMQQYGIFPKFGKPISADPNSYTIKEGINHKEAMNFINILANHSYLGKKILSSIKNEEYFIIEKLSN